MHSAKIRSNRIDLKFFEIILLFQFSLNRRSIEMDPSFKQKHVSVIKKYPTYRDYFVNGCWKWIEGRVKDDNAHGYWRVHDRLYDLTEFVKKHPGGEYWLEFTRVS